MKWEGLVLLTLAIFLIEAYHRLVRMRTAIKQYIYVYMYMYSSRRNYECMPLDVEPLPQETTSRSLEVNLVLSELRLTENLCPLP